MTQQTIKIQFQSTVVPQQSPEVSSTGPEHASEVRRIRGKNGWITSATTDIPGASAVYAGEDNVIQGGVDVSQFVSVSAAIEAFDEPLTMDAVLAIAGQFIVS